MALKKLLNIAFVIFTQNALNELKCIQYDIIESVQQDDLDMLKVVCH